MTEPRRALIADLSDGDVFSLDGGETWHTCMTVLWGTVTVYNGQRDRDGDPLGVRIEAPRHQRVLIRKAGA